VINSYIFLQKTELNKMINVIIYKDQI